MPCRILDTIGMREVIRSALVAHTAAQIYALIVDVERYPQFLPWCVAAQVEQREPTSMVASLSIRRGPLRRGAGAIDCDRRADVVATAGRGA